MITYIEKGNIFNLNGVSNFAHGCNCSGVMGKGIALQFKKSYPKMFKEYKTLCLKGQFLLGDVFIYNYENGVIYNLGTQINWKTKADISAIQNALFRMFSHASKNNINKIALPKIGAGLGGLVWDDVKVIIEKVAKEYPSIDLNIVENYEKD